VPTQASWVEHWLERYCAPGAHRFRQVRPDVVVCEACSKEELVGGSTCLICGIPGEHEVVLLPLAGVDGARFAGRLCGPCYDEFEARTVIDGLRLARAS
jgi:hypothetical protein